MRAPAGGVSAPSGYVIVQVNANGALVARSISAGLENGPAPVSLAGLSGVLSGPVDLTMVLTPNTFPPAQAFELIGVIDQIAVLQIPA